ncbi:MAG TPA: ATP-binding protein [Candidatus Omnitrophota bacterium]|nr:ATP-binding protein [Candidatus Omnitrophota bacterium]HRZ14122.1 ATP-binding protein [Candidatus Omnitrophota bacterium]
MDNQTIRVLMIEDNNLIAVTLSDLLKQSNQPFEIEIATTLAAGLQRLKDTLFDVVLLDLMLPDSDGFQTFLNAYTAFPQMPIIVMTGINDETFAINAVRQGAQDYLVKGQVDSRLLVRSIRYAIERKRIEDDLRRVRDELELRVSERTAELIDANEQLTREIEERRKAESDLMAAYAEVKDTQAQLVYSEKMEVVGRLASGVAHEVKNPLAIILQGIEYLYRTVRSDNENVASTLNYMSEAVVRADSIIKGLLDFSRVSEIQFGRHNLHQLIENSLLLMKHEFSKFHIGVVKEFWHEQLFVNVDRIKIEQVIMNLVMNSVDAMASGGILTLRTNVREFSKVPPEDVDPAADFALKDTVVVLEIEDTGSGIPPEMIDKIFFPFVTTKQGKGGTGLGLPIVKNIMDMHNASIVVKNRPIGGVRTVLLLKL